MVMYKNMLKLLSYVFGVGSIVLMMTWTYMFYSYSAAGSPVINHKTGQIYSLNEHGYISYITQFQMAILYSLVIGAVLSFAVGACLAYVYKKYISR